jgi:hypothetical protein
LRRRGDGGAGAGACGAGDRVHPCRLRRCCMWRLMMPRC